MRALRRRRDDKRSEPSSDITADKFPELRWDGAHKQASLDHLFRVVEGRALLAISWYLAEKRPKAKQSRVLRATAIAFATLGGLAPLVSAINQNIEAQWGYVFVALAAACVAADRFFGLSGAWMRYMVAALTLQEALYAYQLEWAALSANLQGKEPDEAAIDRFLRCANRFTLVMAGEVRRETQAWVEEFRSNLAQLERATQRADAAETRPSAARRPFAPVDGAAPRVPRTPVGRGDKTLRARRTSDRDPGPKHG